MGKYQAADGKIVRGWTVRLEPAPGQAARFSRDAHARRFACNWAVTEISDSFAEGKETGEYDLAVWPGWSLRKRWNQVKEQVTQVTDPDSGEVTGSWWRECSKEACATGIAGATTALKNWQESRSGKRDGPGMHFPKRKRRTKDRLRCTCTTGALRIEGSRTVVLPGAGKVRTAEDIRPIWRHVRRGSARVLSATIRDKAGYWLVSLRLEADARWQPGPRCDTVGVDAGIGSNLLIVMRPDGTVAGKVPNPRALRASLGGLRRASRALARKTEGSPRWREAKLRLARVQGRAANVRSDALHKATTRLAKTHGAVVIEDLLSAWLRRGQRGPDHVGPHLDLSCVRHIP